MHKLWSTDAVEARDRLSYWVEAVCNTYVQLDCDTPQRDRTFGGTIEANRLATLGLSRVTSSPQWVRRTPQKIARATEDYFLVSIQTKGCGKIVQDGRIAELSPGDFALYDSTRPYELIFDEPFQQHVLQLPGAVLRGRLRDTQTLTARKVCGDRGAGHLMIGMINTLAADIDTLEAGSVAAIAESVENILVAGLCSLPGAADPAVSQLTALPSRPDQGLRAAAPARPAIVGQRDRGASAAVAKHDLSGVRGRADFAQQLDLESAARWRQTRHLRSGAGGPHDHRDRVRLGLQRCRAFQPHLPRAVRLFGKGVAGRNVCRRMTPTASRHALGGKRHSGAPRTSPFSAAA